MSTCEWLPGLVKMENYTDWKTYEETLYSIFKNDFIIDKTYFQDKIVNIRKHPIEYGKEEAFFHITCKEYAQACERVPDLRRCERIKWVKAFIENHLCSNICDFCSGIKIWNKSTGSKNRIHILLEEERYLVVIETRPTYNLLITAFYLDQDHSLNKKLKEYEKLSNAKNASVQ